MTGESVATYAQKFGNICRICLKESKKETMSSIFTKTRFSSNSEDESVLAARIASIAQVQVSTRYAICCFAFLGISVVRIL